jgi:hypothetical protein
VRVHTTYKHLEDRIRLGGLTLGQWIQLLVCGLAAYALSTLLPLPGSWSVSVAVTVCGLPAAGAIAFMSADFDVLAWGRAGVRWWRSPKRFAGTARVYGTVGDMPASGRSASVPAFDVECVWD